MLAVIDASCVYDTEMVKLIKTWHCQCLHLIDQIERLVRLWTEHCGHDVQVFILGTCIQTLIASFVTCLATVAASEAD